MMSAPAMNSVLPPTAATGPTGPAPPLALTVPVTKPTTPSPVAAKPQINHTPPSPISLIQDNKPKTPEKTKEPSPALPKPTSNGVEEPSLVKAPIVAVPDESAAPPAPSATVVPAPATAPTTAALPASPNPPSGAPATPAPTPAPTVASEPPLVNHGAELPSEANAPQAIPALAEPAEAAPPPESVKPKVPKPQAPKRRREPPAVVPQAEGSTPEKKPRRMRAPVNPYQSPLPEITTVLNRSLKVRDNSQKPSDEKLIVFYKNEFLAVRNADGGFYLCQTMQNIYRTSHKIRIRWLSRVDKEGANDGIYTRDFYDTTDFECILTTVALQKKDRNQYKMPAVELERVESILKRALDVEKGVSEKPDVTEEHPDGIDLSLYRDESQLSKSKSGVKRKRSPVRKSSSPKKAKKAAKVKSSSKASKAVKVSTPKAKPPARKAPVKRSAPPPVEKKSPRAERISAREKPSTRAAPAKPVVEKQPSKNKAKAKEAKGNKKAVKEKPVETKIEKKQDKKKAKPAPPSPVASSSKKADKAKKPTPSTSSKRAASTRKKGRK